MYFMKLTDSTLSGVILCGGLDSAGVTFGNFVKSGVGRSVELIALGSRIACATWFCGVDCCIVSVGNL